MGKVLRRLANILSKPIFWVILVLLALLTISQYSATQSNFQIINHFLTNIGLSRFAFERILYLIPIFLSGLFFSWRAACVVSFVSLASMLPRDFFISPYRTDAFFETGAVFLIGNIMALIFGLLDRERKQRALFKEISNSLKQSEERYRQLFENAYDAIIIYNTDGSVILDANQACKTLTGYDKQELLGMKIPDLLTEDSWLFLDAFHRLLLTGEENDITIEARLIKKNKSQIFVNCSLNMISDNKGFIGFQNIIRDISEQKQMQENIQFYLHQATRAQEQERKRIALELHDETIQDLIVLSRQLESLYHKETGIKPENIQLLDDVRQQAKEIIQSLRHISQDLRPETLDRLGLLPALYHLATEMNKRSSISFKVNVKGVERRLAEEEELTIFRIAQEALTNIWKHSGASNSDVTLEYGETDINLVIKDDGKGFPVSSLKDFLTKEGKLGLVGMQERSKLINGNLSLQSEPGKGTIVTLRAPL